MLRDDLESILITKDEIDKKVEELAKQIEKDYQGKELTLIGVLRGSAVFMTDLMRHIDLPLILDFMSVSSYGAGTKTSGVVKIIKDIDFSIEGKDVLIVEDILDSGNTLAYLLQILEKRKPNSIKIVTLLNKPSRRKADITLDYCGFEVPDAFVVGYGLDYDEKYRNLPYIGILSPSIYGE